MHFEIIRSLKREPNTCSLDVYNLNATNRGRLAQLEEGARMRVEAGYTGHRSLLFEGDIRNVATVRDGADLVTTVEGDDGGLRQMTARVNQSFTDGATVARLARAVADALGVGLGNVPQQLANAQLTEGGAELSEGTVLSGNAAAELTAVLDSSGHEWSIQNGTLQILTRRQALRQGAVRLDSSTGLVGSPTTDGEGRVTASMLLIPEVFPGRQIRLESENITGSYRIAKAKYVGDTDGDAWTIDAELEALGAI